MAIFDTTTQALSYTNEVGLTEYFFFDGGWVSEDHSSTTTVTKNAIATGRAINDHLILEPKELTLVGVISDTPIIGRNEIEGINSLNDVANLAVASVSQILGTSSRSGSAFATLQNLQNKIVSVHTTMGTYENMAITSLGTPRTYSTGGIIVTLGMSELLIVGQDENTIISGLNTNINAQTRIGRTSTVIAGVDQLETINDSLSKI